MTLNNSFWSLKKQVMTLSADLGYGGNMMVFQRPARLRITKELLIESSAGKLV